MVKKVRMSSKNQITIPADLSRKLNLSKGQEFIVEQEEDSIILTPAEKFIEKLAGSVEVPERFKGKDIETVIKEAKKEYFSKKYGKQ